MAEAHQAQLGKMALDGCLSRFRPTNRVLLFSDDSPGQTEIVRQAIASHAVEAPGRSDAQRRPTGCRSYQGLYQFIFTPL